MEPARTPKASAFLPTAFLLILIGFGGLALLLNLTRPTLFPRWVSFFLVVCGFSGLGLPLSAYLNNRFSSDPPAGINVILRQGIWIGAYAATLLWLQFGRVLGFALALFVALLFLAFEGLLRFRKETSFPLRGL